MCFLSHGVCMCTVLKPFGRDTRVVQFDTVLDRGPGPSQKGEIFGVGTLSSQRCRILPDCLLVLQQKQKQKIR